MGDAYKTTAAGGINNLYGIAWSHPNAGGIAANLNNHGMIVAVNGVYAAAISSSIRCATDMRAPLFYDSNNTAYYTDPASTSNLNGLTVAATITGSVSSGSSATNVASCSGNAATATTATNVAYSGLTGTVPTWNQNTTGNAATATNLSTGRTNWSTNGTITAVVGQLSWKNYGNNHTIFDASNSTSPNGGAVNNTNSATAWSATYPTLMGWNGSSTYGVRVDSARISDSTSGSSASCTGNAATATTAASCSGNAATAYGLNVHTGRNNEANKVVRTDGSGYIQAGWINTTSGDSGFANRLTRIYCSNDDYLRYLGLTDFKVSMSLSGKNNYSRRVDYTADANYHVGSFGHASYGANETYHGGSGFFDIWSGTNYPGGLTHIHGFNALHYTTSSLGTTGGTSYGWQMAAQYNSDSGPWWRRCSAGSFSSWLKLVSYGNNQSGDIYATAYYDNGNTAYYTDPASTSNLNSCTAIRYLARASGISLGTGNSAQLEINNAASGACNISFHREGAYGAHFGLDTDNVFSTQGWSAGGGYTSMRVGNLTASGTVTANSDIKLKKNISTLTNSLDKVLAMRGVEFDRIDIEGEHNIGFIAQEIEKIVPELVSESQGTKSVAYGNITALLVEAIKEQQIQINNLKDMIINNKESI
jgi:hypothetical protein